MRIGPEEGLSGECVCAQTCAVRKVLKKGFGENGFGAVLKKGCRVFGENRS